MLAEFALGVVLWWRGVASVQNCLVYLSTLCGHQKFIGMAWNMEVLDCCRRCCRERIDALVVGFANMGTFAIRIGTTNSVLVLCWFLSDFVQDSYRTTDWTPCAITGSTGPCGQLVSFWQTI